MTSTRRARPKEDDDAARTADDHDTLEVTPVRLDETAVDRTLRSGLDDTTDQN